MTKRELIDEILSINRSASPGFLARFTDVQLDEYLTHLRVLETPRLSGNRERYEKYFRNCPTIRAPRPEWRSSSEHVEEIAADTSEEFEGPLDDYAEPVEDYARVDIQPAERQGLYVKPDDPEVDYEYDEADLPAEEAAPVPADLQPVDDEQPSAVEVTELEADTEQDTPDGEPAAVPAAAAAAPARKPQKTFAGSEEDSEAWLY